jgi:tape measure domain-containing protein
MADRNVTIDVFARDRASSTFNKIGKSASSNSGHVSSFGKTFSKIGVGIVRAAGLATAALGGLAVAGVAMGLKTASSLQQAQIGFEAMLGSGKKAQAFLGGLKKFAAATPFELSGLIDSSRQLLGVGVSAKKVIPFLTDFGDAAGALGIQQDGFNRIMLAMSQSISAGKIKLGDMNQLMNNGLPIWKLLSEAIGKPVSKIQDMISHGKLLTKDVLPKLQAAMHKDYGGAMAKQSQTLSGLWSTFMDTLNLGLADAIMPLVPMLQKVLPRAIRRMGDALTTISSWIADTGIPALKRFGRWFSEHVTPKIKALRDYMVNTLYPALHQMVKDVLPTVQDSLRVFARRINKVTDAWYALTGQTRETGTQTKTTTTTMGKLFKILAIAARGPIIVVSDLLTNLLRILTGIKVGIQWISSHVVAAFRTVASELGKIHWPSIPNFSAIHLPHLPHLPHLAGGGPVVAGRTYVVGEHGTETFVPKVDGRIIPHGATQMMGTPGRGGGGPVYNITVNAGVGANGAEIGSTVVQWIQEYERRNGKRWRAA